MVNDRHRLNGIAFLLYTTCMLTTQGARLHQGSENIRQHPKQHYTILAFLSIDLHKKDFLIADEYTPSLCVAYRTDQGYSSPLSF